MEDDNEKDRLSRRRFVGAGSAAIAALSVSAIAQDRSRTDPGPKNPPLDAQNPDSAWPPATDSKSLVQNFKYPFSFANKRTYEGGWSREVTVRELPVSKTLAGVNMRLTAGGVRELHWHTADEWAIGDVQEQLLSGPLAIGVVVPYAARTGDGTPPHRQGNAGCDS